MTALDGGVKAALHGWDSFLNYYSDEAAKAFAKLLVEKLERVDGDCIVHWNMPDDPYFCMVQDGVKLHELPFTADDGTIVYPQDKNYKSTVYFNFLNRVMRYANALRPNTYLHVFAYTYSEETPAIDVDERLIVTLAPILTNDKYAYDDPEHHDNDLIRDNIIRWAKKTDNLELYMYWCSFRGAMYSRPLLYSIKRNLLWFEQLGIKRLTIEGKLDCSLLEQLNEKQKDSIQFYDMNEAYIWAIHKLMWNPRQDPQALLERYCRIVYKESAAAMLRYFELLQKGWDEKDSLIWYTTGGDVYYLQCVIGAGIQKDVLQALEEAVAQAQTPSVKRKTQVVLKTVKREIDRYKNFEKEEAEVLYCGLGEDRILSEAEMDHINNPNSVWNKTKALSVLRNSETLEYYPKEANFSCLMLYDEKYMYIGYTVFDDKLVEEVDGNGCKRYYREDGDPFISYGETYIGGNVFNQDTYYGFISGFMGDRYNQFYENNGTPEGKPIPENLRDVAFVKYDKDPEKRYYFHVQVIPYEVLGATAENCTPYGSFVYYTNRYGRAGWMGHGLWSKPNFVRFTLKPKEEIKGVQK